MHVCAGWAQRALAGHSARYLATEVTATQSFMGGAFDTCDLVSELPEDEDLDGGIAETAVEKARNDELQHHHKCDAYETVSLDECLEQTGTAPVSCGPKDINKGEQQTPTKHHRLISCEIERQGIERMLAGTPAL